MIMRKLCTFLLVFGLFSNLFGQQNFWSPVAKNAMSLTENAILKTQPTQFHGYTLNYTGIANFLRNAPMEYTPSAQRQALLLSLPLADGKLHTFKVWESPVMAPALAAKFPEIKTYAGEDADGTGLTLRLGLGSKGFHAFIFSPQGQVQLITPYASGNQPFYMAYHQQDLPKTQANAEVQSLCGVDDEFLNATYHHVAPQNQPAADRGNTDLVVVKKYRLAVTAQGEYTQYHGGTAPLVMAAITEAVNYIVAITERDFSVRMELIPNNDTLIYYDPATDPFTGPLIPNWIGDNPAATNSRVSVNSYDIGHLFARVANPSGVYVAGQASLAGVCAQIQKAVAGSSLPNPEGPDYYLIIAHEMGHQFSATHTFNTCPPAQDAQTPGTAYEPGGGSTIMSYATTCSPDIVDDRDPFFHVANLEQVNNFITVDNGRLCAELIPTNNHYPEVEIPLENNFFIPISTPFALTALGTDEDNDNLTYSWEEFDLGPSMPLGQATGSSPLFRSFPPLNVPTRTFPAMNTIVSNSNNSAELLPNYGRDMRFKITVRDNAPGVGGTAISDVRFKVAAGAGPFRLTYPNSASLIWNVGEYQTVTWDVANTNLSPVVCQKVNILMSTDGGFTYPITLAANQPNIGRACIQVPDNPSTTVRLKVEAADNIFFDISNANFKIVQATTGSFAFCPSTMIDYVCLPEAFIADINTSAVGGFNNMIDLSISGLPNGATASFSPNPVMAGQTSVMTVNIPVNATEATFDAVVSAVSNGVTQTSTITLTTVSNDFSAFAPTTPANGASGINPNPLLKWTGAADANAYDVQVASNPSFAANTLVEVKENWPITQYQVTTNLTEGGVYFWRVRAKNDCGGAVWSEPQVFVVSVLSCVQLSANDLPQNITPNGTPTIESKINLLSGGTVSDIDVKKVQGFHDYFKDLEVRLISPAGTNVLLFKDRCGSFSGSFDVAFNDGAAAIFSCPPPTNNAESKPAGSLSTFNGENATGIWTLRVKDNTISAGGSIQAFAIQICSNESTNPPVITVNNPLQPASGSNATISTAFLKSEDGNNTADQLVYTLMTLPQNGTLQLYFGDVQIGTQFTQADIDNGGLIYYDFGLNAGSDEFQVVVADGEGGMDQGTFVVSPTVGTQNPLGGLSFHVAPNPANDVLQLIVNEMLEEDAQVNLYNTAGQIMKSWNMAAGTTQITLQIQELPEGVYALSVANGAVRGVKKVVKR
jgi:subtilisin-like proprotein convertase family protein